MHVIAARDRQRSPRKRPRQRRGARGCWRRRRRPARSRSIASFAVADRPAAVAARSIAATRSATCSAPGRTRAHRAAPDRNRGGKRHEQRRRARGRAAVDRMSTPARPSLNVPLAITTPGIGRDATGSGRSRSSARALRPPPQASRAGGCRRRWRRARRAAQEGRPSRRRPGRRRRLRYRSRTCQAEVTYRQWHILWSLRCSRSPAAAAAAARALHAAGVSRDRFRSFPEATTRKARWPNRWTRRPAPTSRIRARPPGWASLARRCSRQSPSSCRASARSSPPVRSRPGSAKRPATWPADLASALKNAGVPAERAEHIGRGIEQRRACCWRSMRRRSTSTRFARPLASARPRELDVANWEK